MATALKSLVKQCGSNTPPGTKAKFYYAPTSDFTGWPQTKAALGGTALGDTKVLGEAFDFSGAGSGEGFWREVDILVDTGQLRDTLEGEVGGQGFVNRLDFFVQGVKAAQREFADCFVANAGCLICMISSKAGEYIVIGDPDNPCFIEAVEGGTGATNGDRVGWQYTLYANTGFTSMLYDATLGIDLTPNP